MAILLTVKGELIGEDCAQTDREVNDAAVNDRSQDTSWQLCNYFTKEVSTNRVHIVIDFSKENRALIWEDKDDVLDRVECDCHGHKEQGAITILDSLYSTITVLEENNCKDGCNDCDNELNIGGLWETDSVKEVSSQEKTKLIEPGNLVLLNILACDGFNFGMHRLIIILQSRLLITLVEVIDS